MATVDGGDEPLFADDLDNFSDDDPPALPPPILPRSGEQNIDTGTGARLLSQSNHSTTYSDNGDHQTSAASRKRQLPNQSMAGPTDGGQDGNNDGGLPAVKKVRQPMLTFKMDRLFTDDGFPYIVKEFPNLKFKGKGQEVADLKLLLHQYEEWANHLFPKHTFTDFCKKVENMARKNQFKFQVNAIRRRSAGLDTVDNVEDTDAVNERLSPELEDSFPDTQDNNERLSPELEDSFLDTLDQDDNGGLSPVLGADSALDLNGSNKQQSNTSTNNENDINDGETPSLIGNNNAVSSQQQLVSDIPPDPWDIINEEQEDSDPYEDFPDL